MRVKIYSDLYLEFPSQPPLDVKAGEAYLSVRVLGAQSHLWVFGHTQRHRHVDVTFDACRVGSNPRGCPEEGCGFDPIFTVEI